MSRKSIPFNHSGCQTQYIPKSLTMYMKHSCNLRLCPKANLFPSKRKSNQLRRAGCFSSTHFLEVDAVHRQFVLLPRCTNIFFSFSINFNKETQLYDNQVLDTYSFQRFNNNSIKDACSTADIINASLLVV